MLNNTVKIIHLKQLDHCPWVLISIFIAVTARFLVNHGFVAIVVVVIVVAVFITLSFEYIDSRLCIVIMSGIDREEI